MKILIEAQNDFKESKVGKIPQNWQIVKAMEFCDKVTDGTHDTPQPQSEGFFLVTSKNLNSRNIDFKDCYYISKKDFEQINNRSKVEQYDILFGMIGTVGNSTIVYQESVDFAIKNVGLFKMGGDKQKAIWLNNYLSSSFFENYLHKQQAGTTQQFVGLGFLRKLPIVIPTNHEGKADWGLIETINLILSKVDEAIAATENSIKAAERLKKALMQNLLTGKLKPDGNWRNEDEFYVDEKFGKIPIGWEAKRVHELCQKRGETFDPAKSKEIHKYIGLEHIEPNKFILNGFGHSDDTLSLKSKFYSGDILYGKLRPYLNKVVKVDFAGVCSTECLVLFSEEYSEFIYLNFQQKSFLNFTQSMTAGTQHPRASWRDISNYVIITPIKHGERKEIIDKILVTETIIQSKQAKIKTLERLKKSLMQNLLTGKVRVDIEKIEAILKTETA